MDCIDLLGSKGKLWSVSGHSGCDWRKCQSPSVRWPSPSLQYCNNRGLKVHELPRFAWKWRCRMRKEELSSSVVVWHVFFYCFVFSRNDPISGFICRNSDQSNGMCNDYRVRFSCHPPFCGGGGSNMTMQKLRTEGPGRFSTSFHYTLKTANGKTIFNPQATSKASWKSLCSLYFILF